MRKAILYGVGSFYRTSDNQLEKKYKIIGYCYSGKGLSTSESGVTLDGMSIYSPQDLVSDPIASAIDVFIIICSGPWSSGDIYLNLRELGIPKSRIRFINESSAYNIPWQSTVKKDGSMYSCINGNEFPKIGGELCEELIFDESLANSKNYLVGYELRRLILLEGLGDSSFTKSLCGIQNRVMEQIKVATRNSMRQRDKRKLYVAIACNAGFGDSLLVLNLVSAMFELNPDVFVIDYYSHYNEAYSDCCFLRKSLPYNESKNIFKFFEYDLFLQGSIVLRTIHALWQKIKSISPCVYEFTIQCKKNGCEFYAYDKYLPEKVIARRTLDNNLKYIQFPDISRNICKSLETHFFDLPIKENETNILNKYALRPHNYILMNRAAGPEYASSPKLWPIDKFDILAQRLKKELSLKTVQIGADDRFGIIHSVDINLLKKTTLEEIKVLLKNSICLISCEGGLVHLNHFLKGQSIVLFGPTKSSFYGYPENINIEKSECDCECFAINHDFFLKGCLLELKPPKCINTISVEDVFCAVRSFIEDTEYQN